MAILLIDNGTRWITELQLLFPNTEITVSWMDIPLDLTKYELVILSGSSEKNIVFDHSEFINEIRLIQNSSVPIIGICFGCELIAYAFGGEIIKLTEEHKGTREITFTDEKFYNEKVITVYEHHRWGIGVAPLDFEVVAWSENTPEIIHHTKKNIWGIQFHPEHIIDSTDGYKVFSQIIGSITKNHLHLPKLEYLVS